MLRGYLIFNEIDFLENKLILNLNLEIFLLISKDSYNIKNSGNIIENYRKYY